jgi:large subunit ribosomal protein L14
MILVESQLIVADNSGATGACCIRVLGKKNQVGTVGDTLIVSIKTAKSKKKVKKGEVRHAILIRQRKRIHRPDGIYLQFQNNAVVLVSKQKNPIGTRIKGPVVQELRRHKYMKLISMASGIL